MDSNDNRKSDFVQELEPPKPKTEPIKEEPEDNESTDQCYNKIIELIIDENSNDFSTNGQKRKSSENSLQDEDRMSDNSSGSVSNNSKRPRYTDRELEDSAPDSNKEVNPPCSNIEERQKFTLVVSNARGNWTSEQVLDYIRNACGVHISKVNDSREGNSDSEFQIKLNFVSKEQLNKVLEKLKLKEIEGKLTTEVETEMVELPLDTKNEKESVAESNATPSIVEREAFNTESTTRHNQEYETDISDFHIREDYLQSLGISPPITNWINVTNFRCDKTELKEVLELAGKILVCSVVTTVHKYANAMYSHPLEAVQAVSMLNGQIFYGKKLKVTINSSSHVKTLLPKGLVSVGPGLGKFGKSVQDLSEQYKRFIRGQNSTIDASLFQQDLLDKIGVTIEQDNNFTRTTETPYSQTSQNDLCMRNSEDSSENVSQISHMDENQFGPIGQKPPGFHNLPISDYTAQNLNVNTNGPNASINTTCVINRDPGPNQIYNNCPPISGNEEINRLVITSAIISGPHPISGAGHIVGPGCISGTNHISSTLTGPGLLKGPVSGSMIASNQISTSAPKSGPLPMSSTGHISASGPITASGPISAPSAMSRPGALPAHGALSGPGPIPGPSPGSGPSSLTRSGVISSGGPMSGPGPMAPHGSMPGPGSFSGPGHMSGPGPMSGPGLFSGLNQMSGPGSISGCGSMPGPGHMSGPGPISGPGRMSGPGIGTCPRPMTGTGLRPGQMTGPRGPGPNQMVHISIGPRVPLNINRFPGPVSPMLGPRPLVPSGPTTSQIRPNGPRPMTSGCNVQMFRSDPVTLQISNLPPNTNFLNLGHKLSELGHVVYLEFTTPGCAVARFASPTDADRCFQNYRQVLG